MYRYGIVSTASITKRFIDGLRKAGDEVIAIGSRDKEKAKQLALENNIERYYGSYEEIWEDEDVDVVYIPVLNCLHYECAKEALLHKKHVVMEKPFTVHPQEAEELFEIAKENRCFLFEGVKNLFVPSTEFIKENLFRLGKIKEITTTHGAWKIFPEGHWMYDISLGGGACIGSASYIFHYLTYLFNCSISNLDGTFVPSVNSDMTCYIHFNLKDIKVHSTIDQSKNLDNQCVIIGDKGKMVIDEYWRSHHVSVKLNNGEIYEFNDEGNEFVYETKHIHDCLEQKLITSPIIKPLDSIEEVKNIEYLYKKWGLM